MDDVRWVTENVSLWQLNLECTMNNCRLSQLHLNLQILHIRYQKENCKEKILS